MDWGRMLLMGSTYEGFPSVTNTRVASSGRYFLSLLRKAVMVTVFSSPKVQRMFFPAFPTRMASLLLKEAIYEGYDEVSAQFGCGGGKVFCECGNHGFHEGSCHSQKFRGFLL
jgi:hypothetical protein